MTSKTTNEYLQPVLDWLEAGAPHTAGFTLDMNNFEAKKGCGTVCCIAGAVNQFNRLGVDGFNPRVGCRQIARIIGLTDVQANELFLADGHDPTRDTPIENVTPAMAADTLRRFMQTGEVIWK